jgi:hypothetical protein
VETLQHECGWGAGSLRILAAALAQLGRIEEAHQVAKELLVLIPHFPTAAWAKGQPFVHQIDRQHSSTAITRLDCRRKGGARYFGGFAGFLNFSAAA